ncbi:MAG: hypothetical protein ORN51_07035 [Akkermansiaceae bacterium]|nr:hypothetical protein [Akkermansiaceae bacterium]
MISVFKIDKSPEALLEELKGLGQLVATYEWQRACAVDALVREPDEPDDGRMTPNQFAKQGVRGLKSVSAVLQYKRAYRRAVEAGLAEPAILGSTVKLPDVDWREWAGEPDATAAWRVGGEEVAARYAEEARAAGTTPGMAVRAGSNKAALAAAILADPAVEKAAWEAIRKKDAARLARRRQERDVVVCDFGHNDPGPDTGLGSLVEGAIVEAGRRELLDGIEDLAIELLHAVQRLQADHGYTGVADEVAQVNRVSHTLTEVQWAIAAFTVETEAR